MLFVDHTGHLFEMKSYLTEPIGYQYETTPYIFWFNGEQTNNLSVNNYYVLPIRFAIENNEVQNISIKVDSPTFSLCSSLFFDEVQDININESELCQSINLKDLNVINNVHPVGNSNRNFTIYTFYVFCYSKEEGTIMTNVLINVDNNEWCPITVGGVFIDEIEQLIINGNNIGISIPKDILKSVYQESYYNEHINETLFNTKMKEYLINHMVLNSECGNYKSAYSGLKWFGWGEHIELSKLLKTDNDVLNQYVHDYFDLNSDILESFRNFKNTTYLSLYVPENKETGNVYEVNDNNSLWGEGKPELEDLFEKTITVTYDNDNSIEFIKPYYDFIFNELSVKLSCLSYMYKKYFLPIHLSIYSSSIRHTVFENDIKLLTNTSESKSERPIHIANDTFRELNTVLFPKNNIHYLENYTGIIDDNYNEFSIYYNNDDSFIYTSDNNFIKLNNTICCRIPIVFKTYRNLGSFDKSFTAINNKNKDTRFETIYKGIYVNLDKDFTLANPSDKTDLLLDDDFPGVKDTIYNCVLLFKRNGELLHESHFSTACISESDIQNRCVRMNFVIVPNLFIKGQFDSTFWTESTFTIDLLCNNVWYNYDFNITVPEFKLEYAKLTYKYDYDKFKQLTSISDTFIDFNAFMHEPGFVTYNGANFFEELYYARISDDRNGDFNLDFNSDFFNHKMYNTLNTYINYTSDSIKIVDNDKYLNRIHIYEITDKNGNPILFKDHKALLFDTEDNKILRDKYNFKEDTIKIYRDFFNDDGTQKVPLNAVRQYINFSYDFYLMYDNNKGTYYAVFISKDTLDKFPKFDINGKQTDKDINNINTVIQFPFNKKYEDLSYYSGNSIGSFEEIDEILEEYIEDFNFTDNDYYVLKHYRSSDLFLINRMYFDKVTDGINHFTSDDIVAVKIGNTNIPFIRSLNPHWQFDNVSINGYNFIPVYTNTNTAIVSIDSEHRKYVKGYYDVKVQFSIDDYYNHSRYLMGKIRID